MEAVLSAQSLIVIVQQREVIICKMGRKNLSVPGLRIETWGTWGHPRLA